LLRIHNQRPPETMDDGSQKQQPRYGASAWNWRFLKARKSGPVRLVWTNLLKKWTRRAEIPGVWTGNPESKVQSPSSPLDEDQRSATLRRNIFAPQTFIL
jgi:hypothetical protein